MAKLGNITLDKVVSFTEARNNLSKLVKKLPKEGYMVVTKRLEPSFVLVEPRLFETLEQTKKDVERRKNFDNVLKPLRQGFLKYLKKRSIDPKKLTAEEAMEIIRKDAEA